MPAYHVRCAIRSSESASGIVLVNVIHYEVDVLTDPPNYTSIANDLATQWITQYTAILGTNNTLHDLTVTTETYPGAPVPGQGVHVAELAGTRVLTDTKVIPAVCCVLNKYTAVPTRYGRGRNFMPPVYTSTALNVGGFDGASPYITAIDQWAARALVPFSAGSTGYTPEVFSRTRAKEGKADWHYPITSHARSIRQHWLKSRLTAP